MRLSFDHLEQRGTLWKAAGIWLISTVEFTEVELAILRTPNLAFSVSIGQFWVGHPNDRRDFLQPNITGTQKALEVARGLRDENDFTVPLSLKFILSGKPITLFLPAPAPSEITSAEELMTNVFSELKALIAANAHVPGKRTIEI